MKSEPGAVATGHLPRDHMSNAWQARSLLLPVLTSYSSFGFRTLAGSLAYGRFNLMAAV
jgi:hypothetical protein